MKPFYNAGILAGSAVLLLSAAAAAQGQPAPATPAPTTPATTPATAPVEATPAPATTEAAAGGTTTVAVGTEAATEADATATPVVEPTPEPVPEPAPVAADEPAPAAEEEADPLTFSIFADANYAFQSSQVGTAAPLHRSYGASANNPLAPVGAAGTPTLVNDTGFQIAFAGIDAVYDKGSYAATINLRFGTSAQNYHFNTVSGQTQGTIPITQAFVTWRPIDMLAFDVGMFGTIFGAEVAESWRNLNYTRGGLYFGMQPFWHVGLRNTITLSDKFAIKWMLTNDANRGWNYDNPNANAPVFSLQFAITPSDVFQLYIGGMIAEETTASTFETFGDLLAIVTLGDFKAIFNADANYDRGAAAEFGWGGVSLALAYQFVPMFGMAFRQEALFTPDGVWLNGQEVTTTSTLTFDVKPIPDSSNVIIRLDGRAEYADQPIFFDSEGVIGGASNTDIWLAAILGVVVTTN